MKNLVCCVILLIGLTSAEQPTPKPEQNVTKEANNVTKRYIVAYPQYNSLPFTNSQVLPTQQLFFGNPFAEYIDSLQGGTLSYGDPQNYYDPFYRNNYIPTYSLQNVVPQTQNIEPASPQQFIGLLPQQIPPQVLTQQVLPQQVVPQQVVPQQAAPQQVVQQQIVPQQFVQPIVPQQVVQQQVVPQQAIPQQVFPQKVVPQQVAPQRVVPQQVTPQPLFPQQVVPQRVVPQQVIPQQIFPQQVGPQQVVPQRVVSQQSVPQQPTPHQVVTQRLQNTIPTFGRQQTSPFSFQQQRILYQNTANARVPSQYQFYQPESQRSQVIVNNQPYPYEVPPGQYRLPVSIEKQVPIPSRTFAIPVGSPVQIRIQQPASQTYPYPGIFQNLVYQVPSSDTAQQVVRIGYGHPNFNQAHQVQNFQPHTVYVNPNLLTSSDGTQQVVRIGYGHPHPNQGQVAQGHIETVHGHVDNGPQRFNIPLTYGTQEYAGANQNNGRSYQYSYGGQRFTDANNYNKNGANSYQYGNIGVGRATRTPGTDKEELTTIKADITKA